MFRTETNQTKESEDMKKKVKRDVPYYIVAHMALDLNGHTLNTYSKGDGKNCRGKPSLPFPSHLHLPLTKVCKLECYSFCHHHCVACGYSVLD